MKKVLFLTGTRADFGKVKPLIQILEQEPGFEVFLFVTGMHMQYEYGLTLLEIERCNFSNIHTFQNQTKETTMDLSLAKTIEGLSQYATQIHPDLIVVHGDRIETLAGAIVGSLNNILVAHIEGGEISGTIDELLRHSVSKLCHIHFVANQEAGNRLIQMGEIEESIFEIGSPDIDVMASEKLPDIQTVKDYYEIEFGEYAILLFHPVTTEIEELQNQLDVLMDTLQESDKNFVVIYPNNDLGSSKIISQYNRILKPDHRFRIIPSLRFEYFLSLLKNCEFIIGNSSAGVREAPFYNIPAINLGSRQNNRSKNSEIINIDYSKKEILKAISSATKSVAFDASIEFGKGDSAVLFLNTLKSKQIWDLNHQKQFKEI
ncbi:UDP-N-acetylglucosamine 2-epimerase [Christiangramia sp. OXR-203]|jgi:UDP-N-acetylglucosamine 2-epimerase (hydrolysing)|uniref:UDP-N-acetylglucosamine 2-epimerase n=1 Tax=Christiangramia sp. OXR-203 TaxID=3100176 RepID=UPI002AC8A61E|nr:UDP-N-acetylglucosamine 2-epimerase [Christiangramia sp. OXR-203]WPY97897.1 UDP-N-acetylglucosamine 2-epimerase [Christiangramia sp. OXR-203]